MVELAGAYDPNAKVQTSFEPIPVGEYRAKIIECDKCNISNHSNKGDCLKLTWQIETGPYDGRLLWQRFNLWAENMNNLEQVLQIASSKMAELTAALGKSIIRDSDELLHIPCVIKVTIRRDKNGQYEPQNEIKSFKPIAQMRPNPTAQPKSQASSQNTEQSQTHYPTHSSAPKSAHLKSAPTKNAPWQKT